MVAAVTTPLPSVVKVTGFCKFSRPGQFRPLGPNVVEKRCARKVKSELAAAASGDSLFCVNCISSCKRAVPILSKLVQYVVVLASLRLAAGCWSTPRRYALVLLRSGWLLLSTIGSPAGTSAIGAACFAAACTAFNGSARIMVSGFCRLGAIQRLT